MTFDEYDAFADTTRVYPHKGENLTYAVLGLVGESGEVAEKMKKIIRDKEGVISEEDKGEIAKEASDVLWYLSTLSFELGLSLSELADINKKKLSSRKDRNMLHGSGDNR